MKAVTFLWEFFIQKGNNWMNRLKFPDNKRFAFTIFDDTDHATIENVKPIYELLLELNILTTKSVWVFPTDDKQNPYYYSQTLGDPKYLDFIGWLSENGFEIALHNASMGPSTREVTISAFEQFKELLGFYPRVHTNHVDNKENLYWGQDRLDLSILKLLMKFIRKSSDFVGHNSDSPFFWGDICQKHISYVRNFVYREINLSCINPTMPYKDPKRPYVNYWFSSSEGGNVESFNNLLASKNQIKLENEGGICIVYTHLANRFVESGKVNAKTTDLLIELSKRNGWFVPVSTLLDYLRTKQSNAVRPISERLGMELRWFLTKLRHGTS